MKVYDAAAIRNVALVGHSGSGKTQLASALLVSRGCSHAGIELHFACGDRNLRRAAAAEELALAW